MYRYVAILFLATTLLNGQTSQAPLPVDPGAAVQASREVASRSIETLSQLITDFRRMGFESVAEVKSATLGEPMVSYFVRLDELRQFKPDAEPVRLLHGGDLVLYPVLVGNQARTIVEVTRRAQSWSATGFGGAEFTRLLHRFRAERVTAAKAPEAGFLEVRVPALRYHFLGIRSGAELTLIPITDDPKGRWQAGSLIAAGKVFAALSVDAREYNGLPM
jgi:hypothetical protein